MSSKDRTMYHFDIDKMMRRLPKSPQNRILLSTKVQLNSRALLILLLITLLLPLSSASIQSPNAVTRSESQFSLSAETPTLSLSYYSRWNSSFTPLSSGKRIAGDHIILNATWTPRENVNGTVIQVNAPAIPSVIKSESITGSVEIDTRLLGNNATCTVNVTTWLLNGTALTQIFTNVFFGNFFVPQISLISPNGGESWPTQHNITWTASDRNSDDSLVFEVLLSSDSGHSFQLLSSELTDTWLVWDFTPFQNLSTYVVEVRVSDGIYVNSDKSDSIFSAGSVTSSTSATFTDTNTDGTPTAPSPSLDSRVGLFIAAAIIASAFLSLIVYQQAKRLS